MSPNNMSKVSKLTQQTFTSNDVVEHLRSICESNAYTLPCFLDSWHGFDSASLEKLDKLGNELQTKYGWRYVGAWELDNEPGVYHARVAKEGTYSESEILLEIPFMLKLANKFKIERYVDCAPQPTLP